jgi:hypothetical protein
MTALMLLFLLFTGIEPVPADGSATDPVTASDTTDGSTTDEGAETVRKSPIG